MRATEVIEAYISDIVRLLPRRQRNDVAAELRTLLNEELHARVQEFGSSPDEVLALSLVRGYGRPNEVAARYQPLWTIIDPADTKNFVRAAIIGAGALLMLSPLARLQPSLKGIADDLVKIEILAWLGVLVIAFAIKSWICWRWPAMAAWKPCDRDRVNRIGTAVLLPIVTPFIVLYGAPMWAINQVSGGRFETSWAAYTPDFRRLRLPLFIGLIVSLLALRAFVAIQGRWRRLTRYLNIGLNMALAYLVLSLATTGNIFQSGPVDQIARGVLALVALIYVPGVGVQLYGEIGRLDRAAAVSKA